MKASSAAVLLAAATAVSAVPNLPRATSVAEDGVDGTGWSPAPTLMPNFELAKRNGLNQRAISSGALLGYFAQDNTCGFVNGRLGASRTCDTTQRCAAISSGFVGCCDTASGGDCQWFQTCYDSAAVASSSCDHACLQDSNNVICTRSTAPYCYKYTVAGLSVSFFQCDSSSHAVGAVDTVFTTYAGQTDNKSWTAIYNTGGSSSIKTSASSVSSKTNGDSFDKGTTTSGSTDQSSDSPSPSPNPTPKKDAPIGAIVGGVVGGIGALALAAAGLFFLLRRNKNKKDAAAGAAAAASAPPVAPGPAPMQPPYDPSKQQMMQQHPPMQPQPAYPPGDPRLSYYPPPHDPNAYKGPMENYNSPPHSPHPAAPPYYPQQQQPGMPVPVGPSPSVSPAPAHAVPYQVPVTQAAELGGGDAVPTHLKNGTPVFEAPGSSR